MKKTIDTSWTTNFKAPPELSDMPPAGRPVGRVVREYMWIAPVVHLEQVRQEAFFREYGPLLAPLAFATVLIAAALIGLR